MLVNEATFLRLQAESVPAPSASLELRVVSLMHLLALKCHAVKHGHARRVVKDAEDVIQLIRLNRLDPESDALLQLFEEHGTRGFYERVKRACRGE